MKRILVIEDDAELLEGLKDNLELEGYEVVTARDGAAGLMQVARTPPDAIILDLMLPNMSGYEVCSSIRDRGIRMPILILSARTQEVDKVRGFECGADDYITKPFSIYELLARVRSIIRRSAQFPPGVSVFKFGDIEIDLAAHEVRRGRRTIILSGLEFEVLRYLVARRGQTVSRDHLLAEIWGYRQFRTTRAVDNLISRLRQKIEDDPGAPRRIITVYGVGYTFLE